MPKNCWILVAVAWLWLCGCRADLLAVSNARFPVDVWTTDEGLPQNSVITITQTRDGYLWLGTLNGLVRFDGTRFTTFDEGNTPGLNSSRIVKLFEDSHGNLWIGTDGAGIFVASQGKVSYVFGRGAREGRLVSVCEDVTGAVWLYTADGQLGRCRDGQLEAVWQDGAQASSSKCRAMICDGTGLLWIGADFNLSALRPAAGQKKGELPPAAFPDRPVPGLNFLLADKNGAYWRLTRGDGRIQKWKGDRPEGDCNWKTPWNWTTPVNAVCEDQQGNLVVGTGGEGIFWFDAQGNYTHLTSPASGLSHNTILSLCMDHEGNLWAGTDGGGLNRIKRPVFEVLEGSQGSSVQSVCEDRQGGLWIGYYFERIDHWQDGVLKQFTRPQGLTNLGVKSVFVDRDQTVWAGTYLGGLRQLQGGLFLRAPGSAPLAPESEISALFQDRNQRLWAGTQAGLALRDGRNWKLITKGLPANAVRAIAEDHQGNLWIGTEGGGLGRMRDGQFAWFGKTNGLPSDNVLALYVDDAGVLWIGTSSGLARFKDGQWTSYAGRLGLESGSVGYLLEDGKGYLWMGSNAGLLRAPKKALNDLAAGSVDSVPVRAYGKPDGLPTRECSQGSQPAAGRTRDGKLWFPTIKGLVSVNPDLLTRNTNPPPVIIESVRIDGQLQGANALRARAPQAVTVPAGKEGLEITYTSLNLSAPDKGRFRYQMAGFETVWKEDPANIRSVRYPRLPPGEYRFHVTACNEDGEWNPEGSSLAVTVLPPFWRTGWFISIATLSLLGLIIGSVYYVSTQKLQRQLAVLRQHEALERERGRIARDLHDQLGANLTQVALLGEMAESDKDLPHEVEAHAKQISQTARETTRALDEIVWTVNPSNDTLDGLINYVCKYAQEYLAMAGLRYRLEAPPQLPNLPISPELRHNVFLAAKEAINNVVKHAQASSAWLRLHFEPDRFILEIEDNGRGLPAAGEKKGRNGLRNMRKRMEDVGGQFEAGPGAAGGTRVRLTAPLQRFDSTKAGP